jgi:hypothetical protein
MPGFTYGKPSRVASRQAAHEDVLRYKASDLQRGLVLVVTEKAPLSYELVYRPLEL